MSALTDRLMAGCLTIPARRAAVLWAAQNVSLDEDGSIVPADKALVESVHNMFAFNITSAADFVALFRKLCELTVHDEFIGQNNDDTLVDEEVLASRGRDEAYKDAQERNDQDILDLLEEMIPPAAGRGFPTDEPLGAEAAQDRYEEIAVVPARAEVPA